MINSILELGECNRFSKGIFSWVGFNTLWMPFETGERPAGESKWSFRKLLSYSIDAYLGFSEAPLRICSWSGLFFCFVAFVLTAVFFFKTINNCNTCESKNELLQIELAEVQKEKEKKDEEFFEKNAQLQEQQAIAHERAMIEKAKLELEQEKQNLQSNNYNPYANPTRVYDNISVVKDPRRKASSFALVIAIILIAVSMGYLIYRSGKTNHQIAVNLKSVGLIKYQGTYQLNYFIKSSNNTVTSAFNPKMKVSDPSIAKVNETTGYISAGRNVGHTTLEIMNLNDNRTVVNQMEIYVVSEKVPLEDFDIDNSDITLAQGEQEMITIAPIPEDSTECEYEYESSNENCATVNDAGVITAKKNSCSCKITVINGDIKNRINVTVK